MGSCVAEQLLHGGPEGRGARIFELKRAERARCCGDALPHPLGRRDGVVLHQPADILDAADGVVRGSLCTADGADGLVRVAESGVDAHPPAQKSSLEQR
eukprot:scaffold12828_cov112-Isochrysis_galbana.AAC.12